MNRPIFECLSSTAAAGFAPVALFRLRGAGGIGFLNDLVSRDVSALPVGHGAMACLLTAQGKLVTVVHVQNQGDAQLLVVPADNAASFRDAMIKYVAVGDFVLDEPNAWAPVFLAGPQADVRVNALPRGFPVGDRLLGVEGYLGLAAPEETADVLPNLLGKNFSEAEITPVDFEVLRVEAGVPRLGVDAPKEAYPMELGFDNLVRFDKGCYVGQETAKRLAGLGPAPRVLCGVRCPPGRPAGTALFHAGEEVAKTTSVIASPLLSASLGLAFLRRNLAAPGTELEIRTREGRERAEVVSFPRPRSS